MHHVATTDSLLQKSSESVRLSRLAIRLTWQAGPWLLIGIVAVLIVEAILAPLQLALIKAIVDRAAFDLGIASNAPAALGAPSLLIRIALAPEPEIIVADEPISSLDVSIRAEILQLFDRLVRERQVAMLYITHDLLSARLLADDILVLNHGKIVERGDALRVIRDPQDDYTQLLLRSISNPYTLKDERVAS